MMDHGSDKLARDSLGRFSKGISGNRKGRPRKRPLSLAEMAIDKLKAMAAEPNLKPELRYRILRVLQQRDDKDNCQISAGSAAEDDRVKRRLAEIDAEVEATDFRFYIEALDHSGRVVGDAIIGRTAPGTVSNQELL